MTFATRCHARYGYALGAMHRTMWVIALAWLVADGAALAQTQRVRVGIVSDGPTDRGLFSAATIEREVANVGAADLEIEFAADARYTGDWSLEGAAAALDRALAARDVDVVLTLGMLASHAAAQRPGLPKPVIAPFVVDPPLQGYPLVDGTSGKSNFAYIADFKSIDDEVRTFHSVIGFTRLTALVDAALLSALPQLARKAEEVEAALGIEVTVVPTGDDPAAVLAALPADAEAVYVTGLLRFDEEALRTLADGLITRRLPSFSVIGRTELQSGLLMSTGGAEGDAERIARRVVLMIERLANGENAATFDVGLPGERRLAINMRTAAAIGFSPRFEDLADAEQLYLESLVSGSPLTLLDAMRAAVEANPALAASRERLGSSSDDVRIARSNLLPSLDLSATRAEIDADRGNPFIQPESQTAVGLSLEQVIYSERVSANYAISQRLHEANSEGQRQDTLDTLNGAAQAYLDVLRAESAERVRRANVENTRRNLEISRVREAVGVAERSDYLRWVAQLARDKQSLLAAEAARRQAQTELARVMHRPPTEPFTTVEAELDDPLAFVANLRVRALLDTPAKWDAFTDYAVATSLAQAPEVAQAEAVVAAQERAVVAARRASFVPELALVSNASKATMRSGAGSGITPGAPDDEAWSVSLQAKLPLLTGRRRAAELSQARHELNASEQDRAAATDFVAARTRAMLQRTASSYPAIELSAEAAAAANEHLAMVTDAYTRGAVAIAELIDAQDTALEADLAAADAKFSFLADFVDVLRAMGEFDILLDPRAREPWLKEVEEWIATRGGSAESRR